MFKSKVITSILIQTLMLLNAAIVAANADTMLSPAIQIDIPRFQSKYLTSFFSYQHKSIAAISEEKIHEVIDKAFSEEMVIAFDITKPASYYFPDGNDIPADFKMHAQRMLELTVDHSPGNEKRLSQRLSIPEYRKKLKHYFQLIKLTVNNSSQKEYLINYRYAIMFSSHPAMLSADIVEHSGRQTLKGYFIPTIFLPVYLLEFIDDANSLMINTGFRYVLEHSDFHLRGNPRGIKINGHEYSSQEEYEIIHSIWQGYRLFQAEILKRGIENASLSQIVNIVLALIKLGAITHIRATIPNGKNREEDFSITIKVENAHVEFMGLLDMIEAIELPDKYAVSVREEIYNDGTSGGQKAILAHIVTEPAKEDKVDKIFKREFRIGESLRSSFMVDTLEKATPQLANKAIEVYYKMRIQKHSPVLYSLRGDLMKLNLIVKDNMEKYAQGIDNQCSFLISLIDEACSKQTITRLELLNIRKQVESYVEMITSISLRLQPEQEKSEVRATADRLLTTFQGIMEEAGPMELKLFIMDKNNLMEYKVMGIIDEQNRILIQSEQEGVFKDINGSRTLLVNKDTLADILKKCQLIAFDSAINETDILPEDITLYPSKEALSLIQKFEESSFASEGIEEEGLIQKRSIKRHKLINQAI